MARPKGSKDKKPRKRRAGLKYVARIELYAWEDVKMLGPESCLEALVKVIRNDQHRRLVNRNIVKTRMNMKMLLTRMMILFGCTYERALELAEYILERDEVV